MSININSLMNTKISPIECLGFAILILTTVVGNILVLLAFFLDKRLHTSSFYLIANMAIADLLLGLFVLPFSSVLELLNNRWIFGQNFCTAWLAFDVLCCTASIIALMAVSIDRYIGVTRPLTYSSIMTTRRTIYLLIIVWTISILTSVVPLFGLTDREIKSNKFNIEQEHYETCKVNKNTFYTIFSSSISFYIPVIILLILYSRVYQEAKKQGQRLEYEKRRLFEIDYRMTSERIRQKQNQLNELSVEKQEFKQISLNQPFQNKQSYSSISEFEKNECNNSNTNYLDGNISYSDTLPVSHATKTRSTFIERASLVLKRNTRAPTSQSRYHAERVSRNDELLLIKRKLYSLKHEKKAFRTLGLILSVLLICWLPFFVTLPVMSILRHYRVISEENMENIWFKIAFWLGYCNSAVS